MTILTAVADEVGEQHIADQKSRKKKIGKMRRRCLDLLPNHIENKN
jgi:hypothetical protein